MISTESENEATNDTQQTQPTERRKKQRAPWRTVILDDGTVKYNSKPLDPNYFKNYYQEKRKPVELCVIRCERCDKQTTFGHIKRHQQSYYCIRKHNERTSS